MNIRSLAAAIADVRRVMPPVPEPAEGCERELPLRAPTSRTPARPPGWKKKYAIADLQAALDRSGGNMSEAAREIGCDPSTFAHHIKRGRLVLRRA